MVATKKFLTSTNIQEYKVQEYKVQEYKVQEHKHVTLYFHQSGCVSAQPDCITQ